MVALTYGDIYVTALWSNIYLVTNIQAECTGGFIIGPPESIDRNPGKQGEGPGLERLSSPVVI